MNQKHVDLISLKRSHFKMWRKKKACLCQISSWGFPAKFERVGQTGDICQALRLLTSCALSYRGLGNCGKPLLQPSTALQRCGCQPIHGLHLIKPGLRMAGENATSMFLKMGQGAVHMGPCVWSSFTVKITPYYSSHALWVFPCYSSFWSQRQMKAEYSLLLWPLLGGTE